MTDKQKQIEALKKHLAELFKSRYKLCYDPYESTIAAHLYNAGYRKQRVCENVSRYRDAFECSVCHWDCDEADNGTTEYRFCPGCGAKMKGGESDA